MHNKIDPAVQDALDEMRHGLRSLMGNLLRASRSRDGGKPHQLVKQCAAVVNAYNSYVDLTEKGISAYEIKEMIGIETILPESDRDIDHAFDEIVEGSLQVISSHLLEDRLRVFQGKDQICRGIALRDRYSKRI